MEDGSVATDTGFPDGCAGIDVGPTVEEQSDGGEVSEFRGHMQERSSREREAAAAGHAEIEFREAPVYELRIGLNLGGQSIQTAAEQLQHGGRAVTGHATGFEEDVYAGAQAL